jgi:hypothetical protein
MHVAEEASFGGAAQQNKVFMSQSFDDDEDVNAKIPDRRAQVPTISGQSHKTPDTGRFHTLRDNQFTLSSGQHIVVEQPSFPNDIPHSAAGLVEYQRGSIPATLEDKKHDGLAPNAQDNYESSTVMENKYQSKPEQSHRSRKSKRSSSGLKKSTQSTQSKHKRQTSKVKIEPKPAKKNSEAKAKEEVDAPVKKRFPQTALEQTSREPLT